MKIDHVHFYVEDAKASRDWFVLLLGFQAVAAGVSNHTRTEVIKSGSVYFLLSSPLTSTSPVAQFLHQHPPGVADIAFRVPDVEAVMTKAVNGGAKVLQPIQEQQQGKGLLKWGQIAAWGSLSHTLIERQPTKLVDRQNRAFISTFPQLDWDGGKVLLDEDSERLDGSSNSGFAFGGIDHVVLNVAAGDLDRAVAWYEKTLAFIPQQSFAIQTERSGLHSKVMLHPDGWVKLPINQPTSANSQIQEFLEVNRGPGVQHIALQTPNIVDAIAYLRQRGLPFLQVPRTYYTQLLHRQGLQLSEAEIQEIAAQQILVDWEENSPEALLLQIFTQPIFEQPTFFFELIERRLQARGFGEGNFRALFEAIEREQMKRGSLY
jgi:4-hydroxyphenylpyruvate dioxygenase